jgi:3-dehydroquinate synthase
LNESSGNIKLLLELYQEQIRFVLMFESLSYNNSALHFGLLSESIFRKILQEDYANSKKIILTDETVNDLWVQDLTSNYVELSKAEIIQIPSGEEYKTIEVCTQIWEALSEYEVGRNDLIINFGGGVITDLGGFVASLFKRGMHFINIPTTLLSMVDASIGGKTGVDLGSYKNQVGVFSDARHVFIDDRYLETLGDDQLLSGYAEMLKHGLIKDADYWDKLLQFDPSKDLDRLDFIYHSVNIKKRIVEQDIKETGLRKILNFGHTIGHGIEGLFLSKGEPIMHGYGVAAGIIAEAYISLELKLISKTEYEEIEQAISSKFPPIKISESEFKDILKLMRNDKKNSGGKVHFSLLNGIGNCVFDQEVSETLILDALNRVCQA